MTFSELQLHPDVLAGLEAIGFENPTPIQEQAIPSIIEGKDIIGCAQTGTGKTAAFLLPLMHKICAEGVEDDHVNSIIICPTRELAIQIDQQLQGLSYFTGVSSIAIYGGGSGDTFTQEKKALSEGAHIIVGTPGKLISHLNLGYVNVKSLKNLVLDEADRMLDMGFMDDIKKIISFLPKERQNLLFSATMPPKIRNLAKEILKDPIEVNISISKPAERVTQVAVLAHDHQKIETIKHLLRYNDVPSLIIFASRKIKVREIAKALQREGMNAKDISSDLEQNTREEILREFKNKKLPILVATDVISRGIDVDNIDMVINYDAPNDPEDYIHRIGRTARAATEGEAVTFINEEDMYKFSRIEQMMEQEVRKIQPPADLGPGPEYNPKSRGSNPRGGRKPFRKGKRK
ncbi:MULTISPECIES: DEAD/DEAH box helicase [Roseivirga]|uniref:RNA helicase n=1 Tax=Roseivirga spongicola TaxID=333140 RepID=A0A150X5U7_9BACT|nr:MULTISPECIES: DEAD/DEAH box helicase [Roseivirga]KYG74088.1 RNA helicase [Roseivirga spongicola]MBO6495278.1 DEAD/DEAH box helicase [Roseivirga sp.]PWL32241.1 MAG: ATP-dependent helicase [Roseivirga sp. XM-24bin3]WPZ09261.1 DEAD/DEAH box helicase [Roseivirga spongicola]